MWLCAWFSESVTMASWCLYNYVVHRIDYACGFVSLVQLCCARGCACGSARSFASMCRWPAFPCMCLFVHAHMAVRVALHACADSFVGDYARLCIWLSAWLHWPAHMAVLVAFHACAYDLARLCAHLCIWLGASMHMHMCIWLVRLRI